MKNAARIARLRALIATTHAHGLALKAILRVARNGPHIQSLKQRLAYLESLNRGRWAEIRALLPKPKPRGPITMYDSVDVSTVPANPQAVAGYVGGSWPTYKSLVLRFPRAHHLSIAVSSSEDADCLDVEPGDSTPDRAPAWVRRQHARGIRRPVVYANTSTMPAVIAALTRAGVPRRSYRVWTAHYTYRPHIEPGSDATQWTDRALGRNLDASLCAPDFFN